MRTTLIALIFLMIFIVGCDDTKPQIKLKQDTVIITSPDLNILTDGECPNRNPNMNAFFGDLHVHTSYSFDAVAGNLGATPEDANRFARGEEIAFFPLDSDGIPLGRLKIDRPLDFLAVTDHGEFLGEWSMCTKQKSDFYNTDFCKEQYRASEGSPLMLFGQIISRETPKRIVELCGETGKLCEEQAISPWTDIRHAADRANDPCKFTSFIGYEYTGSPGNSSYHRNVIFRGSSVPKLPITYIDAPLDSMLWQKLDEVCDTEQECDYLTIPRNTNLSNGRMAPYRKLPNNKKVKQDYAQHRLRREPIMEIFQHKGTSECVNGLTSVLGQPDELCDIEAIRKIGKPRVLKTLSIERGRLVQGAGETEIPTEECKPNTPGSRGILGAGCIDATDFLRSSLLIGLQEEENIGVNPIKLGIIAATDNHSATPGAVKESDWNGSVSGEDTPLGRLGFGQLGLPLTTAIDSNPGGLAGVWATENTRDAIFDAMLRKEVFGTSGPRIKPRLFGGWRLDENLCANPEMIAEAYKNAVPMGSDLAPNKELNRVPKFLAHAVRDFESSKLQSLQLIKGWLDTEGNLNNKVISIAEFPTGSDEICIIYADNNFKLNQSAYYYLRAVELPSPRWHTYDCDKIAVESRPEVCKSDDYPKIIREMAWTSPIWYQGVQN